MSASLTGIATICIALQAGLGGERLNRSRGQREDRPDTGATKSPTQSLGRIAANFGTEQGSPDRQRRRCDGAVAVRERQLGRGAARVDE